jgi:hypothetical protein
MARRPRGARPEPAAEKPAEKKVAWKVQERFRLRCPICGMLPEAERLTEHDLYPVEVYLQRFGGSFPGGTIFEKQGYMVYEPVDEELERGYKRFLVRRLEEALARLKAELE